MLRELDLVKNRKIWILLCVELFFILIGVIGLFGKSGIVLEREDTQKLMEEGVSLPAGVYTLRLYYEAEESDPGYFGVTMEASVFKSLLCNMSPVYANVSSADCQFYLLSSAEHLKAELNLSENVTVLGMEIITGTEGSRIYLFWIILFCVILNSVLLIAMYHRKHPLPAEKLLVLFGLPAIALLASFPVLVDYTIDGADFAFHVNRINALAEAVKNGESGIRMQSLRLGEPGYTDSVFMGDTFLIVPALLRILGFHLSDAYGIFLVIVNLVTALISYISFSRCFRNRKIGLLGCALYTLAPYRIDTMYNRAAVDEFTAIIFLPLLLWGFYRIYTEEMDRKGYLWNWVIPVIGLSGMVQSSLLICGMAVFFVIVLCLILWKKTFRKRTLLVTGSVAGMTIVLNLWFLLPFFDMMTADPYSFHDTADHLIQSKGILPAQIFYTLQAGGRSVNFSENGMVAAAPVSLGAAILVCLLLWLMLRGQRRKSELTEEQITDRRAGDIGFALTALVLFMSTCYFPWDFLSSASSAMASLTGALQSPARLTIMATAFGVFTACVMGSWALRENVAFLKGKYVLMLVVLMAVIFAKYQTDDILVTSDSHLQLYTAQSIGDMWITETEYLPAEADTSHMIWHLADAISILVGSGFLVYYIVRGLRRRGTGRCGERKTKEQP